MQPEDTHAADGTPLRLGRYRLVRLLSTGGMARVYEARREAIEGVQPRVALKVILPEHARDEAFRQLFITEARVGSLLRHQNLVQVQDFDADQGLFYLVMELVEGITLRQALRQAKRQSILLSLSVIAEVGRQICDGLHHAHSARTLEGRHLQLVHRDLKPSNLMINPQGVVKLLDFGISKAQIAQEREGIVRGTWGYMAPEQADGSPIGPAADLFGLAAVLYEMAALQPLFAEKDPETIKALLAADEAARRASRLSGQHGPLVNVLIRALQRDPQARYPSAAAMGRALANLAGDPITARENLVRFQKLVVADKNTAAPERRAPTSAATLDEEPSVEDRGLPLRVGDVHRPERSPSLPSSAAAAVAAPPAARRPPGGVVQQIQAILAALFIGAAAGIIGFTAWKVFSQRPLSPAIEIPDPAPAPLPPSPPAAEGGTEPAEVPSTPIQILRPSPSPSPSPAVASEPPAPSTEGGPVPGGPAAVAEPPAPAPALEPEPEPVVLGSLTIGARPWARVLVDGEFVSNTPLFRHPVAVGSHVVTLESRTGERVSFPVAVVADQNVQKMWSFETNEWIKEVP